MASHPGRSRNTPDRLMLRKRIIMRYTTDIRFTFIVFKKIGYSIANIKNSLTWLNSPFLFYYAFLMHIGKVYCKLFVLRTLDGLSFLSNCKAILCGFLISTFFIDNSLFNRPTSGPEHRFSVLVWVTTPTGKLGGSTEYQVTVSTR